MNKYYVDEQTLREVVEMVGKTAAAACISSFLGGVVLSTLVNPQPTKIVVENGVPANIYTVGGKDAPRAVYVSSKPVRADWKPVLFFGAVFAACKFFLEYREDNVPNIIDS